MADQSISELVSAEQIRDTDLFLLEQGGDAKSLAGRVLLNWLTAAADGHGGIQSIDPIGKTGLVTTYRITLADTTTVDFAVTDGRGIVKTEKAKTEGLVDTWRFTMSDDTYVDIPVTNGAKGDKGDNAHTWVKYASQQPTDASHNMGDIPDDWRGEYTGTSQTAPTDWKQYKWYKIKGDRGETGAPAALTGRSVTYMASDSGTIVPSGSWSSDIPTVTQGRYLWTRVVLTFNSGSPVTYYSVSRMGLDGSGAVSTVNGQSPDSTGNVKLTSADISGSSGESLAEELAGKADEQSVSEAMAQQLPLSGGTMSGQIDMGGNALKNLTVPVADTDAATKGYVDGRRLTVTATITTDWVGDGPYTQTVAVEGLMETDMPHVTPVYDTNTETAIAQREAWGCVSQGAAAAGGIRFTCFEDKPETAIPIQIEVMR